MHALPFLIRFEVLILNVCLTNLMLHRANVKLLTKRLLNKSFSSLSNFIFEVSTVNDFAVLAQNVSVFMLC